MRSLLLTLPFVAMSWPVLAQPVDQPGADALSDALARYVSKAAFESGIVRISPEGDAYRMDFDFNALAGLFSLPESAKINVAPYAMRLKPRTGGTWLVEGTLLPPGSFQMAENNISMEWSAIDGKMSGVYDPELFTFSSALGSFAALKVLSSDVAQDADTTYTKGSATMSASKAANGGVDFSSSYRVDGYQQTGTFKMAPDEPGFPLTIKGAGLLQEADGVGYKAKSALDLLAFAVANPSREEVAARQPELKSLLLEALPFWEKMTGRYAVDSADITTPVGILKFGKSSAVFTMGGLSDDTSMSYDFQLSGIAVSSLFKPAWANAVTPTDLTMGFTLSNVRSGYWGQKVIEAFDIAKTPPIPDSLGEEILMELVKNPPKLTVAKSTISNDGVEITFNGEMTLAAIPVGSFEISAKGFQKVVEAVAGAASTDSTAGGMMDAISYLVRLAKRGPDGLQSWTILMRADGAIFLNDIPVKQPGQTP